jgi:hypothetical protein
MKRRARLIPYALFLIALFISNWGRSGSGEVEMYMIELPSDWVDQIP